MRHDLGTVTIFRILGLRIGFGLWKGCRLGLGLGLGLEVQNTKIENYENLKIVTFPIT
jgi:hypothetical protein